MHNQVVHFRQFLHSLQVHIIFFKMIQMDVVVIFLNNIILIFE
jgi:hypothetical protein